MEDNFEHYHLDDPAPAADFDSTPSLMHTSKAMVVGEAKTHTVIDPSKGIGIGMLPDFKARMVTNGQYYTMLYANGSMTSTPNIDWANGNVQNGAVTQATTLTFLNGAQGGRYILMVRQDESGSRTLAWPPSVVWPGGTAPTTSGSGKLDLFTFVFDGGSYFSASLLNY